MRNHDFIFIPDPALIFNYVIAALCVVFASIWLTVIFALTCPCCDVKDTGMTERKRKMNQRRLMNKKKTDPENKPSQVNKISHKEPPMQSKDLPASQATTATEMDSTAGVLSEEVVMEGSLNPKCSPPLDECYDEDEGTQNEEIPESHRKDCESRGRFTFTSSKCTCKTDFTSKHTSKIEAGTMNSLTEGRPNSPAQVTTLNYAAALQCHNNLTCDCWGLRPQTPFGPLSCRPS